jgi:hypothetical protein
VSSRLVSCLLSLFFLGTLVGCGGVLNAAKKYKENFTCSAADFESLEKFIQTYLSGQDSLEFTSDSPQVFETALEFNRLIGDACPIAIRKQCLPGKEQPEIDIEADFAESSKRVKGPIEGLGFSAYYHIRYDAAQGNKERFRTALKNEAVFRKATECFINGL